MRGRGGRGGGEEDDEEDDDDRRTWGRGWVAPAAKYSGRRAAATRRSGASAETEGGIAAFVRHRKVVRARAARIKPLLLFLVVAARAATFSGTSPQAGGEKFARGTRTPCGRAQRRSLEVARAHKAERNFAKKGFFELDRKMSGARTTLRCVPFPFGASRAPAGRTWRLRSQQLPRPWAGGRHLRPCSARGHFAHPTFSFHPSPSPAPQPPSTPLLAARPRPSSATATAPRSSTRLRGPPTPPPRPSGGRAASPAA